MLFGQLCQDAFRGRRLPLGCLGQHRQFHFLKQDFLYLFGRGDIENRASFFKRHRFQLGNAFGEFGALRRQHVAVHPHTGTLDLGQHRYQRHLNLLEQVVLTSLFLQPLKQHLMQAQRDLGILSGIGTGVLQGHFVERQLVLAFARHLFKRNGLVAEILERQRVHVMARPGAVEDIGFQHRVKTHAGKRNAMVAKHSTVVLKILTDLFLIRILQQRPQCLQHFFAIQLRGRIKIIVRKRDISPLTGFDCKGDTDNPCPHGINGCRLGIESEKRRLGKALKPT